MLARPSGVSGPAAGDSYPSASLSICNIITRPRLSERRFHLLLQLRDLRLLDPQLATSYPSAILARDSALVVNLEFIKCIVTTDHALVLNPGARDHHGLCPGAETWGALSAASSPGTTPWC